MARPSRLAGAVALLVPAAAFGQPVVVTGTVTDGIEPIAGAIVCGVDWDEDERVAMPTAACAVTEASGAFEVGTTLRPTGEGQITAGAEGYFNTATVVFEGATTDVPLYLLAMTEPDNPDYLWWSPRGDPEMSCNDCHDATVTQWETGRHAIAATDPWVRQMFLGTDEAGDDDVAPGYRLDHDDAGDCGACHAATATWSLGASVAMDEIPEEHVWGVFCDSCHKIRSATPGAAPGTLGSLTLWRPSAGMMGGDGGGEGVPARFNFGAYANVLEADGMTAYLPLFRKAELCAGCHQQENAAGVVIMDTWDDWQQVGDPGLIQQCQACHMKDLYGVGPGDETPWVVDDLLQRRDFAQRRDLEEVYRHEMWGGEQYAAHALDLMMSVDDEPGAIVVETSTMNVGANHRVPTGMPFREMILVVSVVPEGGGDALPLAEGTTVGPRGGDLAQAPGFMFAKSLGDADGALTFAFWDATQVLEDTRLATGQEDSRTFRFEAPASGSVVVTARLLYRRASQALAEAKGWDPGEIEIARAEEIVTIGGGDPDAGPDDGSDYQEGCVCRAPGASARGGAPSLVVAALVAFALGWRRRPSR